MEKLNKKQTERLNNLKARLETLKEIERVRKKLDIQMKRLDFKYNCKFKRFKVIGCKIEEEIYLKILNKLKKGETINSYLKNLVFKDIACLTG